MAQKLPFYTTLRRRCSSGPRSRATANRSSCRSAGWRARTSSTSHTPFNFVSTADTIGGNSGSPVLNRAGELVGINFDRNRHGLVRNFVYTDEQARHIAVHGEACWRRWKGLYGANSLIAELTERK